MTVSFGLRSIVLLARLYGRSLPSFRPRFASKCKPMTRVGRPVRFFEPVRKSNRFLNRFENSNQFEKTVRTGSNRFFLQIFLNNL